MEFYMHGVKVGAEWYEQGGLRRAQNWMESGSPVSEMYWNSNGEGEGTWRMWSGSGQILREVPYVDGKVQAARARCYTEAGEEIPRCRRSVPESPEQRRWIRPEERTCRVDADCTAVRLPVDSCGCTMGAVNVRSLPRVRRLHRRLERLREQHPRNCLAVMDVCLGNSSACVQRRCQLEQVLYWLLE
jgi:hypothetical protein